VFGGKGLNAATVDAAMDDIFKGSLVSVCVCVCVFSHAIIQHNMV
jgi:hypothetical protein